MSTCVHQNYNSSLYHDGDKKLETTKNGIKVNIGTSKKPLNIMYVSSPPHNVVTGDMYFDTSLNVLRMYDGQNWLTVSDDVVNQEFIDEFDILLGNRGFFKVKLYQDVVNGARGVQIYDEQELYIDNTEDAIEFIKNNIVDGYLWVEKRILEHLG